MLDLCEYILMHIYTSGQPDNILMCTFRHPTFWCTGHNILLLYSPVSGQGLRPTRVSDCSMFAGMTDDVRQKHMSSIQVAETG